MKKVMIAVMVAVLKAANLVLAQESPKMKMTTEIPPGIATPDELGTRLGTLRLTDGVPDKATVEKIYDNLDFHHGLQGRSIKIKSTIATVQELR